MKKLFVLNLLFQVCLFTFGQTGNTLQNPINAGTFGSSFQYSNSQNTANFTNDYQGQGSKDVFYRFTLTTAMKVTISHCGSSLFDTYLHLLDASGTRIRYNDDFQGAGGCPIHYQSYIRKNLTPGTYYVVSEGYSGNGTILTTIEGDTQLQGDSFADAIDFGLINWNQSFTTEENTLYFANNYPLRGTNDVFHKFTLCDPFEVTIKHCESLLYDTYLHILDSNGNRIIYNDDSGICSNSLHSYIKTILLPGTYYIVSEGYSQNGLIHLSLEARYAYVTYTYDACGNMITRTFDDILEENHLRSSKSKAEIDEETDITDTIYDSKIIIRPNPTEGPLTIELPDGTNAFVQVINSYGSIVVNQEVSSPYSTIDITSYPQGIYMVNVRVGDQIVSKKIIKK
jgi:hypothetical protein